jgi:hypothetical protein
VTLLSRFMRSVRREDLRTHLLKLSWPLVGEMEWEAELSWFVELMLASIEAGSSACRDQLMADAERICGMTDEVGQAALLALPQWQTQLRAIDGAHVRAHWLYLQSPDAFRQAEEIRYADENQNARKLWDAFVGPRQLPMRWDERSVERFRDRLRDLLRVGQVHIESFSRTRVRQGEPDRPIEQVTIYSEGLPHDELVFDERGIQNRPRKPVRETAITYEPESGTIEVIGAHKATRQDIACVFAEMLLGHKITGERLPLRRYDLTPLLSSRQLATLPQDGVAKAKLTMLAISTFDQNLTQRFQVPFKEDVSLHAALEGEYGEHNPLRGQVRPQQARIEVEFEPKPGCRRGKKVNVDLGAPNKCSLRGKTAQERLILGEYLRSWGLARGA